MYKLTSQTYTATKHDNRIHMAGWLAASMLFFLNFVLCYCTAKAFSATLKHCVELLASGHRAFLSPFHPLSCLPANIEMEW